MLRRAPLLALPALMLVAPTALPACSSGSDRLVIYSGRTEALVAPLLEDFAEETGTKIDVRYGDTAELALLIEEEGDQSPADVFLSQSPGAVDFLDAAGRLAELPADTLGLVGEGFEASDGTWVGLSGRVRTLVYDATEVDPSELPDSVLDLTDPTWGGRVAVAPSNGSFQDFVTAVRAEEGDDAARAFLEGMEANDSPTYPNNLAIVQAVGRGEVDMGLVNHYYLHRERAENPDITAENHFFASGDLGSLVLVTAASMIEGSDKADDARRFIEFMLSDAAQRYFADETFEYPLAAGVDPSGDVPPLDSISTTRIDLQDLGGGLERTAELIEASGLNRD